MTQFKLFVLALVFFIEGVRGDGLCSGWDAYKDEKCFIVLDGAGQQTFQAAKDLCIKHNGTLAQITSAEEQDFLTNMVFNTHKVVDEVWIGAHRDHTTFRWDLDNTQVSYTNWAQTSPSNVAGMDCLQMLPKRTNQEGKWDDESCDKKNIVLCQKYQIWTAPVIQQTLLKERKRLEELQNELKSQIDSLKKTVSTTIPIGFTYVQLAKEKAPAEIWPTMKWKEVSAKYAGLFFRVMGGSAAAFGTTQEDDSPRLHRIAMSTAAGYKDAGDPILKGGLGKIKAGATGGPWYFQFEVSNTEVRPRNLAMKIWQRES